MEKSCNDIDAQVQRCIALANELGGKWTANAKNRADTQYFAQMGRRVKNLRGIPMFGVEKDRKYPMPAIMQSDPEPTPEHEPEPTPVKTVRQTPTEQAHERMALVDWMASDEANRKKIQDMCRHDFVRKMYAELLTDYTVCELEGWDMFEFPRMLRDALAVCFPKQPKQLSLF